MTPHLLGGRYHLHSVLGRGGMATVWAGVDARLHRPVAVKVLDSRVDPEMVHRFDREARAVALLAHPNVVAVYDVGTEDGLPYLVMERVEGDDLRQRLTRGPLDIPDAVAIGVQICDALTVAHRAGVVHRDIKPDNVLLTTANVAKVCDFGIARLQQAAEVRVTRQATTVGTSEYMAPEQAMGAAVDARADLYALGCVLYAMLTGDPPFSGDSPMQVLWRQVHEPPLPVTALRPETPTELAALIGQLLAKDAAHRPASAADVRERLARIPGTPAGPGWPPNRTTQPASAMHGRAAVVTPTRTMSTADVADPPVLPGRTGLRFGPAAVAAVALGAAVIAALVVALLMAGRPARPAAAPPATSSTAARPTAAPTTVDVEGTAGVRAAIEDQVRAGQLDARTAADLSDRLDDIDRALASEPAKASARVGELRDRLAEMRKDGKISDSAYGSILAALDQLAATLPPTDRRGNGN